MRIGTRGSALALAQAELIAELIGDCEIVPIITSGDHERQSARAGDPPRTFRASSPPGSRCTGPPRERQLRTCCAGATR
jgi:hypothetical protein